MRLLMSWMQVRHPNEFKNYCFTYFVKNWTHFNMQNPSQDKLFVFRVYFVCKLALNLIANIDKC